MRNRIIILSLVLISSCHNSRKADKPADSIAAETIEKAEVYEIMIADSGAVKDDKRLRQIGLGEKIGDKTLSEYLSDPQIPQIFKDVFQQKRGLYDDGKTSALIDSLSSTDRSRHPFYFVLATRAAWWSDGAFSEPLGMAMKEYVESNTQQFLTYFATEPVLTSSDLELWAEYIVNEMLIESDGEPQKGIEEIKSSMQKNRAEYSSEKLNVTDRFIEDMYKRYDETKRDEN